MNRPADDVINQIRSLQLEERERVITTAADELEGEVDTKSGVRAEIERRATRAMAHPEECLAAGQLIADMRAAVAAIRARRGT